MKMKRPHWKKNPIPELSSKIGKDAPIKVWETDSTFFQTFLVKEPNLLSSASEESDVFYYVIEHVGTPLVAASFYCSNNKIITHRRNKYCRLDIVITDPKFRGHKSSTALIYCGFFSLLSRFEGQIYSLSSMAYHKAVAHILEKIGFESREVAGKNYVIEELKINQQNENEVFFRLSEHVDRSLKIAQYQMRN